MPSFGIVVIVVIVIVDILATIGMECESPVEFGPGGWIDVGREAQLNFIWSQ